MNVDAIPLELRDLPRWVVWRWGDVDEKTGKRKKPPYQSTDPRRYASSTKQATWGTFTEAITVVESGMADGIGFALEPPYVGVDLDEELPIADQGLVMDVLDSYSERSVSGTGFHVVLRASLNGSGRHPTGIGVFQTDRLFYFSGEHVQGTPTTIEDRQAELEKVLDVFLPAKDFECPVGHSKPMSECPVGHSEAHDLDDQELLEHALAAKNGDKFRWLWAGAWEGRYGSQSQADQALCNLLAFWTSADPGWMDSLFRRSGLMRPKWDSRRGESTYGWQTIANAIAEVGEVYAPRRNCVRASDAVESVGQFGGSQGDLQVIGLTASALKEAVGPTQIPNAEARELLSGQNAGSERTSDPDPARPFAMPIRDFIALERPHREALLADTDGRAVLGRHSLVLLGALGGHGKTTFSFDLFLHLAAGVDFPPFTVPAPVSVLMIENEGPEELFAEKLAARLESFPHELKAPLDVFTFDWGGFSLSDVALRERLVAEIAQKKYDLVFGDPLDSLGIEGVGSPEDTRRFMALMKETGLNKTVAWWLNTHPRKEETKEALNEISGAWGGKPDSVLLLKMLEDDRTQVRFPKLRWTKRGTRPPILLAFDADTEAFTFIGEQTEEKRGYLREVFAFLQNKPWQTVKDIAAPVNDHGIGANDSAVKKVLDEHPDIFESRTGEDAVALGRKSTATLWGLLPDAGERLVDFEEGRT